MADTNNPSRSGPLTVNKNDFILIFVDNLSLADITLGGLLFIIFFIVTYFVLIIWACFKDRQKQVYSQRVASGQNQSQISYSMPRRTNFRAVNIDITSDTLDFTNQSVRVNFEDQRDLSALFQHTHNDAHATVSPMHRIDQGSSVSPHPHDKRIKFNMMRTPQRGSQKIDLETGGPPSSTCNDDDVPVTTGKDEVITKEDTTIKDDGTLAKEISNIIEDMSKDDEFMYNKTPVKKEPKRRAKERSSSIKVTNKAKQGVKSKFWKLLGQRHVILSTIKRMSRISPRYKRVSLLAFLLALDLFGMTLAYIDLSRFDSMKVSEIITMSICAWIMFAAISWLSSVSKDALKTTKSNDDFMRVLAALEKEAHYKDIAVHVIIGLFALCAFTQFGLFFAVKSEYILQWLLCSFGIFLIQIVFFDCLWLFIIAVVYIRAYDSQRIRRLYRNLNSIRFWKV